MMKILAYILLLSSDCISFTSHRLVLPLNNSCDSGSLTQNAKLFVISMAFNKECRWQCVIIQESPNREVTPQNKSGPIVVNMPCIDIETHKIELDR